MFLCIAFIPLPSLESNLFADRSSFFSLSLSLSLPLPLLPHPRFVFTRVKKTSFSPVPRVVQRRMRTRGYRGIVKNNNSSLLGGEGFNLISGKEGERKEKFDSIDLFLFRGII